MQKHSTDKTANIQSKVLLIRMWEILRRFGSDRPLSLEDIRQILIEDDRSRGIEEDPQKDQYNLRLLRSNIKAINAALNQLPTEIDIPDNPERAELLARKQRKEARKGKKSPEPIGKIIIGRGESKECLYYNSNAFTPDEVRFLHDAVNAQDCLTQERANKIGGKLIHFLGQQNFKEWEYRVVQRPPTCLTVSDVFVIIKKIEEAIKDHKRIIFQYMKGAYDPRGWVWEPGMDHVQDIDPIAVYFRDGRYFLYGYNYIRGYASSGYAILKRYRTLQIDRMARVTVLDEPSEHTEDRERFFKTWRKYKGRIPALLPLTGEPCTQVTLRIPYRLEQDMYDKFGTGIRMRNSKKKRGRYFFNVDVCDVPELFKWVLSYGGDVEILQPSSVRSDLAKLGQKTRNAFIGRKAPPRNPT